MGFAEGARNMRKVARDLETAPARAQALVSAIVVKTLADIEADAKTLVPVRTGNLRNSISRELTGDTFAGSGSTFGGEVGPTANYGRFVEFGTSRMRPRPYLLPALARREPGFLAAIKAVPSKVMRP